MTLYRYGPVAWVWRVLILAGLTGGCLLAVVGVRDGFVPSLLMALPLLAPALYFGAVVAVRVDGPPQGPLEVSTLLFWRRRIRRDAFGVPTIRTVAQADYGPIYAPRVWVPVRGSVPVYLDLLAEIPDRRRLDEAFGLGSPGRLRR